FSKYQDRLLELYKSDPYFVIPEFRQNEMVQFVSGGLQDFSISRLKEKMPWGVDVPGDESQVMYVWFDALVNYISCLGWPESGRFEEFWPGVQVCGKDNLRQQSAMWQAMLMSAGLITSKQILVGGFLQSGGQKMSKSLGNVIDPVEWVEKYGVDALRYFLTASVSVFEDSDVTLERFEEAYQASLANGIGNLCARVAAMAEKEGLSVPEEAVEMSPAVIELIEKYEFDGAMSLIWERIAESDGLINSREVWKLEGEEKRGLLIDLVKNLRQIGANLQPFMPETAEKILSQFNSGEIKRTEALFMRLEK
ncbi:MAG: Methionine-tRNA ligase, partial [Candidatus Collierbacteria bacterium GW2011_GWA1_44_12]